ncbi:MAG: GTP-binding protein [Acidobacteriaceae bacterium]|nr:GTP-binding protein [Acidobacteriaceae bacterium]
MRLLICLFIAVSLASAATYSGSVTDAATGKAIPGAIVTVGSKVVRTSGDGAFRIEGSEAVIAARAYGYGRTQVRAESGGASSLQLKLTSLTPHALYLSFWGIGTAGIRETALHLAKTTPINAVVIDVKGDLGYVSYKTAVPLATEIGAQKIITIIDIRGLLERLHNEGLYTIARIVTFKDNKLGSAYPKLALHRNGAIFKDREGLTWCDPFLPEVRDYNIDLAVDAAKAGFDEIQFDYVRFPDTKGVQFSQPSTEESRPKAIIAFLSEAKEKLTPYNVFLAADVFGYICWNKGDTGIGQQIEELGGPLDYISPMLYPSGFLYGVPNYRNPVSHPYEIVRLSLDRARERTKLDPVRFRPWLQAFADYAFDKRQFGEEQIQAQIKAAESFGSDGWLLWNPRNVYSADTIRSLPGDAVQAGEAVARGPGGHPASK